MGVSVTMMNRSARWLVGFGVLGASAAGVAAAQAPTYAMSPAYAEGANGGAGWSRVPVRVTYACVPPPGFVLVSCPPPETLGANLDAPGPFVRTAVYQQPGAPAPTPYPVTLMAAPRLVLRGVDGLAPRIVVAQPVAGRIYDAGVPVASAFSLAAGRGSSPETVAGTVASGQPIPVGVPDDPAAWGSRSFDVTARDAAGNTAPASVLYTVDDLPGAAALAAPAEGQTVAQTPPLSWTMAADDGAVRRDPAAGRRAGAG